MPIIDGVFAAAQQARHRLNQDIAVADFDRVGVDHHVDAHPDQATGNRVRVPFDLNRAARVRLDAAQLLAMIKLIGRQLAEVRSLLGQLLLAARVALIEDRLQEMFVVFAAVEVA
ncbi:hypothetical protein Pla8534_36420 [Lignipirellula cremea]|uniref:Uncharacterized protein n=1 Tax=Lignipirellula cremea TaxID=2528010 RepID=A0A518DVG4_9BACT|nr:hypothetical protein [Lignipirellula cremea]QDU95825.1 hypothetical protein Pla8534_36420 [Lignipirellula cremea]